MAEMPKISISAVDGLFGHWDRDIVLLSILDGVLPPFYVPFPPGCNHVQLRVQSKESQLKSDLTRKSTNFKTRLGIRMDKKRPQ